MKRVKFVVGGRILDGFVRSEKKIDDKYTMVVSDDGKRYLVADYEFIGEPENEREICAESQTIQETPKRKRGRPKKNVG